MGGNRKRLYIALYPSRVVNNEERREVVQVLFKQAKLSSSYRFRWGFAIGPKNERGAEIPGMRYRVKNHPIHNWVHEEIPLAHVRSTNNLLARIVIAKIQDETRLIGIIRNTPVIHNDHNWSCRTWAARTLSRIAQDGWASGTAELDWEKIETVAREHVATKIEFHSKLSLHCNYREVNRMRYCHNLSPAEDAKVG